MPTIAEQRFLERVPSILQDIADRMKPSLKERYLKATSEGIDTGAMGTNDRHAFGHPQTLYGDVLIWLRDNGYGKDHDLAALIVGNHAVDRSYNGEANSDLFTPEELKTLSAIFHEYKDSNRGCDELVRPAIALEKKVTLLTGFKYEPDTTYDTK